MIRRPLCLAAVVILGIQFLLAGRILDKKEKDSFLSEFYTEEISVEVQGTVYRREERPDYQVYYLTDNQVRPNKQIKEESGSISDSAIYKAELPSEARFLVYVKRQNSETNQTIAIGNKIQVTGILSFFEPASNPGNFDRQFYYEKQGISAAIRGKRVQVTDKTQWVLKESLAKWKMEWKHLLVSSLGNYYGNSMSAILLGDKSELDTGLRELYQKSGIGHILAISGLHMSFIGIGLYQLLRKAGIGFLPAGITGIVLLALYTLLVGAGISSIRALIMYIVRMGAEIAGRDYDLLTSLALAASVIALWQPLYLFDAGFLLSFGAILGVALLCPILEKMHIPKIFCSGIAIHLMLLPIMLYFYFEIPVWSVILNLFVIPLTSLVLGAGLAGSLLSLVWRKGGSMVLQICKGILFLYEESCSASMNLPFSRVIPGQPKIGMIVLYYVVLAGICVGWKYRYEKKRQSPELAGNKKNQNDKRKKEKYGKVKGMPAMCGLFLVSIVFCAGTTATYREKGILHVTAVDVGQGDCFYIKMPNGISCMMDGGSSNVKQVGSGRIEPFLKSQGVGKLDYVFVSHGDEDHICGIRELLENQRLGIEIHTLVLPIESVLDESLRKLAITAAENNTRVVTMTAGEQIGGQTGGQTGGKICTIACLAPGEDYQGEAGNAASMVLALNYGAFDMLFTGDLEQDGEKVLSESECLESYDILKVAHHGSKNATSEAFLEKVKPTAVWISAGRKNRYGHPHQETIQRLEEAGCKIYSTQQGGALTVTTDGEKMWMKTFL